MQVKRTIKYNILTSGLELENKTLKICSVGNRAVKLATPLLKNSIVPATFIKSAPILYMVPGYSKFLLSIC